MRTTTGIVSRALALAALLLTLASTACADSGKTSSALPRFVDLGADKCVPCKKMAPMLEELRKDYAGIVDVTFIDVWKNSAAGKPYRIRVIPTQVFYDQAGREVFRHEGYFSREEIEKIFKEKLGVTPVPAGSGREEKKD